MKAVTPKIKDVKRGVQKSFALTYYVKVDLEREITDKMWSWGNGHHDVWVALHDTVERGW